MLVESALRVIPAETRLTVYRRLQLLPLRGGPKPPRARMSKRALVKCSVLDSMICVEQSLASARRVIRERLRLVPKMGGERQSVILAKICIRLEEFIQLDERKS